MLAHVAEISTANPPFDITLRAGKLKFLGLQSLKDVFKEGSQLKSVKTADFTALLKDMAAVVL